jgi:chromosome segregation ATPase
LAASELAGVLSAGTAEAANALTAELGRAKDATGQFGTTVAALQPAGETACQAIQNLGTQAETDAAKLADVGERFEGTVEQLKKAEGTLKKLLDLHAVDTETPLNRLVQALDASASKTAAAAERFDKIQDNLREAITAVQTLTHAVQTQVAGSKPDSAASQQLITRLGELRVEMGETNAQLKVLGARFDASAGTDNKPKSFRWFRGAR